jgi:mono/diheme cytochrome c family protein
MSNRGWRYSGMFAVIALASVSEVSDAQTVPSPTTELAPVPMDALASEARRILDTRCYRCHGDASSSGNLGSVRAIEGMIRHGFIIRGSPDGSPLVQRLRPIGDMPLRGDPLPEVERETLRRWIRAGAPPTDQPANVTRTRVELAQLYTAMADDLAALPETTRPFVRYFTLHHLHNAALSDASWPAQRTELEDALLALVNSLSWQRNFHRFHALANGLLLRFDLRLVGWTTAQWAALLHRYPYASMPTDDAAQRVVSLMGLVSGREVPCLRGDWFVANASRSPLYETLLQLPSTRAELERRLSVDVTANRNQYLIARAGFRQSGVSHNNRVIERHESPFGTYWQSFDFADNLGRHDVFQHPLGPGPHDGEFEPAGGEIIFTLPNGLQGYMLVNGAGRAIADAPTAIVHDSTNHDDPVIHNGFSCVGCHGLVGVIPKSDEVRSAVESAGADSIRRREVEALYASSRDWSELLRADSARYREALSQLLPVTGEAQRERLPVATVGRRFNEPMSFDAIAGALDVEREVLAQRVTSSTGLLRQTLGPVAAGASLAREQFECAWSSLASELSPNVVMISGAGSELRSCGDQGAPRVAPSPTCSTEWHPTETFNVASNVSESNWQREAACGAARAGVRTRVEPVCTARGSTAGGFENVTCECTQERPYGGRPYWVCRTVGTVSCGRYERVCARPF